MDESTRKTSKSLFDDLLVREIPQCHKLMQYATNLLKLKNWSLVENAISFLRCDLGVLPVCFELISSQYTGL